MGKLCHRIFDELHGFISPVLTSMAPIRYVYSAFGTPKRSKEKLKNENIVVTSMNRLQKYLPLYMFKNISIFSFESRCLEIYFNLIICLTQHLVQLWLGEKYSLLQLENWLHYTDFLCDFSILQENIALLNFKVNK